MLAKTNTRRTLVALTRVNMQANATRIKPVERSGTIGERRTVKRDLLIAHCNDSCSVPAPALAAHFHWVFHCVMPESQLSGVLARR